MRRNQPVHIVIGIVLLLFAGVLAFDTVSVGQMANPDKQLEVIGRVLAILLGGVGGLYLLVARQSDQLTQIEFKAELDRLNTSLISSAQLAQIEFKGAVDRLNAAMSNSAQLTSTIISSYANSYFAEKIEPRLKEIEAATQSATKFIELEYQDDFRKRERRDQALLKLSGSLIKTTRAFRTLTKFKLTGDEPIEALVTSLAQALAARESFLSSREELDVLHAVDKKHRTVLREYSTLLINIIIDIRRSKSDEGLPERGPDYNALMSSYETKLLSLDEDVGNVLAVFLSPKHRDPISPDIPTTPNRPHGK